MSDPANASTFVVARDDGPQIAALRTAVVAIGNFDGVHRGHRSVIELAMRRAKAAGKPAAVLTLEPHPRSYFRADEQAVPAVRRAAETAPAGRHRARRRGGADLQRRACRAAGGGIRAPHPGRAAGRERGRDRLRFSFRAGARRLAGLPERGRRPLRLSGRYRLAAGGRGTPGLVRHHPHRAGSRPGGGGRRTARLSVVRVGRGACTARSAAANSAFRPPI